MFPSHCISQGTLTCSGNDIPLHTWFSGFYVSVNEVTRNLLGFSTSTYSAASSSTQHWAVDASLQPLQALSLSNSSSHCLPLITGGLADSQAVLKAVTENSILRAPAVTPHHQHTLLFSLLAPGLKLQSTLPLGWTLHPLFYERLKREAEDFPWAGGIAPRSACLPCTGLWALSPALSKRKTLVCEAGFLCVTQAALTTTFMPQPPEFWDYG